MSANLGIREPVMAACHGAVTYDLLEEQMPLLSESTRYVTLTIGGNDAGFSNVMNDCVARYSGPSLGCSLDSNVTENLDEKMEALAGLRDIENEGHAFVDGTIKPITSVKEVLRQLTEAAPNALIYIAGYPKFFGTNTAYWSSSSATNSGGYTCEVNTDAPLVSATVGYTDGMWLNSKAAQLNGIIRDAAEELFENEGKYVIYVGVDGYSRFLSHGLCDSGLPWINDVDLDSNVPPNPLAESFHPNVTGMEDGYGSAFTYWMGPRD